MARPPEPLAELLAEATQVVVAEVTELLAEGAEPSHPGRDPHIKGGEIHSPSQRVRLRVSRVLVGAPCSELVVAKPEAPYLLAVGNHGPFFLRGERIIGRYGPDTHRLEAIEAALAG